MKKDVNGTVTLFIYNQSGQLIAEANGSGVIQREYAYYQNRPIALLAYGTTADVYYYHADHLNTPQVITDQAQGVVWQGDYEPFGEVDITTDVVENNLRFPGQYYDAETGSYYNYFRDYEPSLGRYTTSDPIGLDGGINTYLYVNANPLSFIDPLGLASCNCKAPGGGTRKGGEKICTYNCNCDKCGNVKVKASAGFGGSAMCKGQEQWGIHEYAHTEFKSFKINTDSMWDKVFKINRVREQLILIYKMDLYLLKL